MSGDLRCSSGAAIKNLEVFEMKKMSMVKKSIICAVCIALCIVLPMVFHAIGAGTVFLPMHIPVLICGLVCGWPFGVLCGVAGPALSSILTGMPAIAYLPVMMVELIIYGAVTGICMSVIRTKSIYADLYVSLAVAIVSGRVIAGIARALIFAPGNYTMAAWVTGYFVTSWPGTLIQFVFIPTIVFSLMQARLIPKRYKKALGESA